MPLLEKLLHFAGKDGSHIDEKIGKKYILSLCWCYGLMMLRGKVFSIGSSKINKSVFIGKKVRTLEKQYLSIGAKTKVHDGVYIDALSRNGVTIGNRVVIGRNSRIECTGSIESIGKGITIGDNSSFGSDCYFGAAGGIIIGENVVAGQYVRFHSENHRFDSLRTLIREQGVTHKGIIVGNNCWIGAGAVFLDGSCVGDGCVIGANAVVTKSFPENSVIGGNPARIIKMR